MLPMPSVKGSCLFITWHSVLLSRIADLLWHQSSQSRLFMLRKRFCLWTLHVQKYTWIQVVHPIKTQLKGAYAYIYIYMCIYIIYDGHDIYKNAGQTNVKPTPHARLQHTNMSTPGMIKPQLLKRHIKLHAQHVCVSSFEDRYIKKSLQWISRMLTKQITHLYWWTAAFNEKTAKKRPNKNKYVNKHGEKEKRGSQDKMKAKHHTNLNSRCTRGSMSWPNTHAV